MEPGSRAAAEALMREIADELRGEVERMVPRLRAVTAAEAGRDRGDAKWQKREILGHLIDSAYNNHQRFVRAPRGEGVFVWPGYEQDYWVVAGRYRTREWLELVELWVAANRHLAHTMEAVPAAALGTPCTIGGEAGTLEWWMRDYIRHMRHHLAQIAGE
jgi:hypothetical protein